MTILSTAFAVVMFLASIAAHEAGHAFALRGYGVPITEAGLGFPFRPRKVFAATKRRPWAFSLSPWLLGAYVMADPEHMHKIDELGYRHRAWYAGAGVLVNFIIGFMLLAFHSAMVSGSLRAVLILVGASLVLFFARTYVVAYVFPLLMLPALTVLGVSLVHGAGEATGPAATAVALVSTSFMDAVKLVGFMNVALGILNLLPFHPLDGGRIAGLIVRRFAGERGLQRFERVTLCLTAAFFVYVLASDLFLF